MSLDSLLSENAGELLLLKKKAKSLYKTITSNPIDENFINQSFMTGEQKSCDQYNIYRAYGLNSSDLFLFFLEIKKRTHDLSWKPIQDDLKF